MAHKRPGVFKGQVRGVSHQGQEKTLHLKAGYIDADFPSFETFPLHSHGGPYIRQVRVGAVPAQVKLLKTPFELSRWRGGRYTCDTLDIMGCRNVVNRLSPLFLTRYPSICCRRKSIKFP